MLPYFSTAVSPALSFDHLMLNSLDIGTDKQPNISGDEIQFLGLKASTYTYDIPKTLRKQVASVDMLAKQGADSAFEPWATGTPIVPGTIFDYQTNTCYFTLRLLSCYLPTT